MNADNIQMEESFDKSHICSAKVNIVNNEEEPEESKESKNFFRPETNFSCPHETNKQAKKGLLKGATEAKLGKTAYSTSKPWLEMDLPSSDLD
mmetsp:Transcript_237/g.357  ORF Transcript_237/g.357 Transcript_237/m.357 type:complete len:93 (-) Transcript_237:4309-4587(-)